MPDYADSDFVYIDPALKEVIGKVEWTKDGLPKSLTYSKKEVENNAASGKKKSKGTRKHYPWGTYRSMKRIYRLEGKVKDAEPTNTLDDILPKALNEAFWE